MALTRMEKISALHMVDTFKREAKDGWGTGDFGYARLIATARVWLNHDNPNYREVMGNHIIRKACKMRTTI